MRDPSTHRLDYDSAKPAGLLSRPIPWRVGVPLFILAVVGLLLGQMAYERHRWAGVRASAVAAKARAAARWASQTAATMPSTPPGFTFAPVAYAGHCYFAATVDLDRCDVGLFWKDPAGRPYRTPPAVARHLTDAGRRVLFVTNAGIFDPTFTPVGLHVEEGQTLVPLNLATGDGNFFLKPNGVFFIDAAGVAHVVDAIRYDPAQPVRLATQSGPLLLSAGTIHRDFRPDSTNLRTRSGVGVAPGGRTVTFALSVERVTFHEFATFFRDRLHCPDALYLDGEISRFYVPGALTDQPGGPYAGMLAITVPDAPASRRANSP